MIKKSLFALFTTLIAGGVLLVGSTEGFEYVVGHGSSKIAFDQSSFENGQVTKIEYGDPKKIVELSTCEHNSNSSYGYECTINGEENNDYHVYVTFANNISFSNVYLNGSLANVKRIINYNGPEINSLDLNNNTGIDLNSIKADKIEKISINNSSLDTFALEIEKTYSSLPKHIFFKDNHLYNMPDSIRCYRATEHGYGYNIQFSNSVKYQGNNYDKIIYLEGNPLEFVGITKIDDTETYKTNIFDCPNGSSTYNSKGLHFERFGYSKSTTNPTALTYTWTVSGGNLGGIVTGGTTTKTGADISPLNPGFYTFEVLYTDDTDAREIHRDSINFEIPSYKLGIGLSGTTTINSPDDNISFERGNYNPDEFDPSTYYPNGYSDFYFQYKLAPTDNPENIIYRGEANRNTFTTGYDSNKLTNGSYTFTVSLGYNDYNNWHPIQADGINIILYTGCYKGYYGSWHCNYPEEDDNGPYTGPIIASKTFSVEIDAPAPDDPTLQINRPLNEESGTTTYFSWTPNIPEGNDFSNYTWNIKKNGVEITGGTFYGITETGFTIDNLDNGTYTFYVELNYTRDGIAQTPVTDVAYTEGVKTFEVNKTFPSIHIDRPLDTEEGDITYFSWTPSITPGFECNNYEWFISENDVPIITGRNLCSNTGYQTGGLNNGTYKFNVKLNYTQTSNGETGYAVDSRYASYGGSMTFEVNKTNSIRITNPSNGSTGSSANVTFTWEKNLSDTFSGYEIILTGGNNNINTGKVIKTESTTTRTVNDLRDGSYRFKVIMHYTDSSNNPQTREDDITFYIDASAGIYINITKPSSGSNFTGEGAREIPIEFEWNGGGSPLISGYSYTIKKGSTTIEQGTRGKNESGIYTLGSKDLSGGTYTFTVTMLAKNGAQMIDESSTFTIVILSDLNILSPQDGDIFVGKQNVQFSRSGFAEFSHYKYSYTLEKTKKGTKTTIKSGNNLSLNDTGFTQFLENGNYEFTVRMMDGSSEIKKKTHRFEVLDITGLVLTISDGSSSWNSDTNRIEIKTGTVLFNYGGKSEDFSGYYYSITGTNFKGETFIYTGKNFGELTGSLTLTGLLSGKYRFVVRMVDDSNSDILTGKLDFNVTIPSKLTITNPTSGSIVTSSSITFSRVGESDILRTGYTNDKRHYEYELLQLIASGYEQKAASPKTNANSFSYSTLQDGATYQLNVKLYSGSNTLLASDTSTFSISIPRPSGGGGGGGSSSKSHPTNDLAVNITNDEPTTDERVEVVVDVNDKYTGKVDFTKMQYYSFDEEKWIDIPVTSDHYVSDSSDDAKLGYVKFTSDDDGEKELSEFLKFSQPGNYRLYAEDKDGYREYVEFYIGKGSAPAKVDEEDYYIARSCKKYKIEYYDKLGVYSSPNLLRDEFFVSRDYFYRYIDSKNKQIDGCPTNYGWINTTYNDTSNSSQRYTAPNGKVYFISNENGTYSSSELNKELNGAKRFSSINELKYFIRDRNPFINMYAPVK